MRVPILVSFSKSESAVVEVRPSVVLTSLLHSLTRIGQIYPMSVIALLTTVDFRFARNPGTICITDLVAPVAGADAILA